MLLRSGVGKSANRDKGMWRPEEFDDLRHAATDAVSDVTDDWL